MRQVSFTLLITGRCNSNPAQYERNRRFGHLVHALGRAAGGATLPSAGLSLNASKAESRLGMVATIFSWSPESREVLNDVTLLGARGPPCAVSACLPSVGVCWCFGIEIRSLAPHKRSNMGYQCRRRDSESSADDLRSGRGVVLGRAVTTLRSVETQPQLGRFVRARARRIIFVFNFFL